jgi:peptidoglycan/LPS O-acetylase OafA/YrhL
MKNTIYLKGLNGLRALASLAVVFSHTTMGLHYFGLNQFYLGKYPDGSVVTTLLSGFGVSIFFTLSGFLITFLLLNEKQTKEISVKNFYMRRILRIWPVYYLYIFLVIVSLLLFGLNFSLEQLMYYFLLAANFTFFSGQAVSFLYHYWSLGVEEQFYAFWPWVVKKSKLLLKTTVVLCVLLLFLKITFRFYDIIVYDGSISWPYELIHGTRFHCMLIGAIAAMLYYEKHDLFLQLTDNIYTQIVCWIVIFLVTINKFHLVSFLDNELISIVAVCLIVGQINQTNRIVNLETPYFNFIGKISYGIYVFHPLIIFYWSKVISFDNDKNTLDYILVYFLVFSSTILLSYFSYTYFERIFLKIKERY